MRPSLLWLKREFDVLVNPNTFSSLARSSSGMTTLFVRRLSVCRMQLLPVGVTAVGWLVLELLFTWLLNRLSAVFGIKFGFDIDHSVRECSLICCSFKWKKWKMLYLLRNKIGLFSKEFWVVSGQSQLHLYA